MYLASYDTCVSAKDTKLYEIDVISWVLTRNLLYSNDLEKTSRKNMKHIQIKRAPIFCGCLNALTLIIPVVSPPSCRQTQRTKHLLRTRMFELIDDRSGSISKFAMFEAVKAGRPTSGPQRSCRRLMRAQGKLLWS